MARDRPSPYVKGRRFFHRSAGACPPRTLERADDGEGQGAVFFTVARGPVPREFSVDRSMARDRPSPYGDREAHPGPDTEIETRGLSYRHYTSSTAIPNVRRFSNNSS